MPIRARNDVPINFNSKQENIRGLFNKGYAHYSRTVNVHNLRWPKNKWKLMSYNDWLYHAKRYVDERRRGYLRTHTQSIYDNRKRGEARLNHAFRMFMINRYGAFPTYKNEDYNKLHRAFGGKYITHPIYPDIKKEKEGWLFQKMLRAYDRAKQKEQQRNNSSKRK